MAQLIITPGQTERFEVDFSNGDNSPIDLTGVTVSLDGVNAEIELTNAIAGMARVMLSAEETALITKRKRVRFRRATPGGDTALDPYFWLVPE